MCGRWKGEKEISEVLKYLQKCTSSNLVEVELARDSHLGDKSKDTQFLFRATAGPTMNIGIRVKDGKENQTDATECILIRGQS